MRPRVFGVIFALLAITMSACASPAGAVRPVGTENQTQTPAPPQSTATNANASATPIVVAPGNAIAGTAELVDALRASGATVTFGDTIEQPFFSVKGQKIEVNNTDVQVFEYSGEGARQTESDRISPDGTNIGTAMVTWVDQPNFWAKGRIILLYVGKDDGTIRLLSGVLGNPLTQPRP